MPPTVVKLVAVLLLVVQGLIASAPGRVLCIPLQDCGTHQSGASTSCDHCDSAGCDNQQADQGGSSHQHGPFHAALHPEDECGCHVHVPVPGDQQVASNQKTGSPEFRALFVPLVVAVVLTWDVDPPAAVKVLFPPPDFSASDQVRALKATRLLI